jgi:hypothetical protein
LRGKITAQGLNAIRQNGGESAVYELCKHHVGRKTLLKDERLRKLITAEVLNTTVMKDENKTATYWLLNTPEGKELLEKDPELRGKLSADKLVVNKEVASKEVVNKDPVPVEAANPNRLFSPAPAPDVQKRVEAPVYASPDVTANPPAAAAPPPMAYSGYYYPDYQNPSSAPAQAYYNYYYPGYQNQQPAAPTTDYSYYYPGYPKP